jgi:hypothetical protein
MKRARQMLVRHLPPTVLPNEEYVKQSVKEASRVTNQNEDLMAILPYYNNEVNNGRNIAVHNMCNAALYNGRACIHDEVSYKERVTTYKIVLPKPMTVR